MPRMVSYSRRPQSGQITCYFKRTYHVLPALCFASAKLRAFSASRDEVVASDNGLSNFCTDASDSPSFFRRLDPASWSEFSTSSFMDAYTSSQAGDSAFDAFTASRVIAYW